MAVMTGVDPWATGSSDQQEWDLVTVKRVRATDSTMGRTGYAFKPYRYGESRMRVTE